jgi:hypothetical protein
MTLSGPWGSRAPTMTLLGMCGAGSKVVRVTAGETSSSPGD